MVQLASREPQRFGPKSRLSSQDSAPHIPGPQEGGVWGLEGLGIVSKDLRV